MNENPTIIDQARNSYSLSSSDIEEYQALRSETLLRISLQNVVLLLTGSALFVAIGLMIFRPEAALVFSLSYIVLAGTLALNWAHHAARITQIKHYVRLVLEARMRAESGWERWHAINRVSGMLGSKWRISTIGVFIGSQIAALGFGLLIGSASYRDPLVITGAILIFGSALLLTPPRMSAALRAQVAASS